MCIEQFFNNASIGSFLGAFFAFFLVVVTDWRRNKRKKKLILKQIQLNRIIVKNKIETINNHKNTITQKGQLYPGKLLPFQTEEIKTLSLAVIDQFKPEEKLALDAISHHMRSTDELLDEVNNMINEFINLNIKIKKEYVGENSKEKTENLMKINIEMENLIATIKTRYEESIINLKNLDKSTNHYLNGNFDKILTQI